MKGNQPPTWLFLMAFMAFMGIPPGAIHSLGLESPRVLSEAMLPNAMGLLRVVGPGLQGLSIVFRVGCLGMSSTRYVLLLRNYY